jgi:hypothetical protein
MAQKRSKAKIRIAPYGKWRKLIRDMNRAESILEGRKTQRAMEDLAETAKNTILEGLERGREGWAELSDVTKEIKGGSRLFVDSGSFMRSIGTWKEGKRWFAGITPGAKGDEGQDLEVVGAVQEGGAFVPVSDAMRAFFAARGFPLRGDTKFVRIPARPWFAPAVREFEERIEEELSPWVDDVLEDFG